MTGAPAPAARQDPLIVTLIAGFLGVGKTTLLNRMRQQPDLVSTAVPVNNFGEVGLDYLPVERLDDDTLLLNEECLCCTVRGDLVRALRDLAAHAEQGHAAGRGVVKAIGLSDPPQPSGRSWPTSSRCIALACMPRSPR